MQVPGYELGDVLGRGGFAAVYRAVQVSVGPVFDVADRCGSSQGVVTDATGRILSAG